MHEGEKMMPKTPARGAQAGTVKGITASFPFVLPAAALARAGAAVGCWAPARRWNFPPDGASLRRASRLAAGEEGAGLRPATPAATCPRPPPARSLFYSFFFPPFFLSAIAAAAASPHHHRGPLGDMPWQLPHPSAWGWGGDGKHAAQQPSKPAAHPTQRDG